MRKKISRKFFTFGAAALIAVTLAYAFRPLPLEVDMEEVARRPMTLLPSAGEYTPVAFPHTYPDCSHSISGLRIDCDQTVRSDCFQSFLFQGINEMLRKKTPAGLT